MATLAEMKAKLAEIKAKQGEKNGSVPATSPVEPAKVAEQLPAVVEVVVQTDLQPAALVVVERPAVSTAVGQSSASGADVQSPTTQLDTSNPVHAGFLQRLADLEAALLARDPLMKTHLGMIHKTMIEYEEIPNLLTIAEIRTIMEAQQSHTGVVLRQDVVKSSKAAATRKSAQIKLEDV